VATVARYPVGQFPPIPLITVPDVTALTQSQQAVSDDLRQRPGEIPGLEVTVARCDDAGLVVNSAGTVVSYGDGSGTVTNDDGTSTNTDNGDGTGLVDGLPIEVAPVPPLGEVGSFPDVEALAPVGNVCGTLIRLPADVLFDSDEVRAGAAPAWLQDTPRDQGTQPPRSRKLTCM